MTKALSYFIECPLRNSCLTVASGYCEGCEDCLASSGFVKGGEELCELCQECIDDELGLI